MANGYLNDANRVQAVSQDEHISRLLCRLRLRQPHRYHKPWHTGNFHYANTPMLYTAIFHGCKNINVHIFFLFLLKTLIVGTCLNRLNEAVLTSTHNLCFGAKIRK